MKLSLLLEMAATSAPERVAVGSLTQSLSYAELELRAKAGAAWLATQPGDKTVFIGLNGWAFPALIFASARAGKPITPLNYRLPDADLNRLLALSAPATAVVDDDMIARLTPSQNVSILARSEFEALCTDATLQASETPERENEIALLLFTSGTTGEPKTAVLKHRHLTSYVISTVEFMNAEETDASLVSVPPYHIAGVSAVLTGTYSGRRTFYLSAFTPEDWVETVEKEKISHAMVVPTMLDRILDVIVERKTSLPHLKALSYGGGKMPLPVIERALECLPHVAFVNAYGLTETSSTISVLGPDDHRLAIASKDTRIRGRLNSVGRPIPGLELKIADENGNPLMAGKCGEICVRGDQVAGEYLQKSAISADGWFPTNDSGWLDDDGYLYLNGRLDDVIVRGGENISPGEIEDVLRQHKSVKDVAVIGLPDTQWGEKIGAVIVPSEDSVSQEDLALWVKARLRSTKTPEFWEFRDELPYNETGKLLRRILKAELSN